MMCKIRFRGRRADNGDWVRGGNILQFAGDGQTDCYLAPSGETVVCRDDDAGHIAGRLGKSYGRKRRRMSGGATVAFAERMGCIFARRADICR